MKNNLITISSLLFLTTLAMPISAEQIEPIEPEMITVATGSFQMGSDIWHSNLSSKPAHNVSIQKYALAKYEVTNREFKQFIEDTSYDLENTICSALSINDTGIAVVDISYLWSSEADFEPVSCISPKDAKAYVSWLAQQTSKPYRLVTEAEWEYAARADQISTRYYFGNDVQLACEYENVGLKNGAMTDINCADNPPSKKMVGVYKANPWGFFDMVGNVFEYTADCFHIGYTGAPANGKPWLTNCDDDNSVIIRSGSFVFIEEAVTGRSISPKGVAADMVGLRIAMDLTASDNCLQETNGCKINNTTKTFRKELIAAQKLYKQTEKTAKLITKKNANLTLGE